MGAIGFFDSGFGGLAIMRDVVRQLPTYDYVYFGDTANNPYGPRPREEVYRLTENAVAFLLAQGCELIIVACNTASSEALRQIQQNYLPVHAPNARVLGVIIPAAEAAAASKNQVIGVIATQGTVASGAFATEITKLQPNAQVYQQACPLLVPLIEAGQHRSPALRALLRTYLAPLMSAGIDSLILGCTHYGLIKQQIVDVVGPGITIIDEGPIIAQKLSEYLARHPEIEQKLTKNAERHFYCSDKKAFNVLASQFYGEPIISNQVVL